MSIYPDEIQLFRCFSVLKEHINELKNVYNTNKTEIIVLEAALDEQNKIYMELTKQLKGLEPIVEGVSKIQNELKMHINTLRKTQDQIEAELLDCSSLLSELPLNRSTFLINE